MRLSVRGAVSGFADAAGFSFELEMRLLNRLLQARIYEEIVILRPSGPQCGQQPGRLFPCF
ncbi:hypothetical protein WMW72_06655 [Paenibacillus filicis]|uniref:Uncharacterized protein n=1 Tax=Paenibacillus filicis TaxID=669464 RepID=A0ABU9DFE1_9BACL